MCSPAACFPDEQLRDVAWPPAIMANSFVTNNSIQDTTKYKKNYDILRNTTTHYKILQDIESGFGWLVRASPGLPGPGPSCRGQALTSQLNPAHLVLSCRPFLYRVYSNTLFYLLGCIQDMLSSNDAQLPVEEVMVPNVEQQVEQIVETPFVPDVEEEVDAAMASVLGCATTVFLSVWCWRRGPRDEPRRPPRLHQTHQNSVVAQRGCSYHADR